ncbi:MAG: hypothetical protein QOH90_664, partial [Actinomycetota bacterium]|nr:hypothetical protein [Actinomycetota bacterium]
MIPQSARAWAAATGAFVGSILGWHAANRIVAVVTLVIGVACLMMRRRPAVRLAALFVASASVGALGVGVRLTPDSALDTLAANVSRCVGKGQVAESLGSFGTL